MSTHTAPFVNRSCAALSRNWTAVLTCVAITGAGIVAMVVAALTRPELLGIGMFAALGGLIGTSAFLRYRYLPVRRTGELVATPRGITMDGEPVVTRGTPHRALLREVPNGQARVQVLGRQGELLVEIEVPGRGVGEALIAAAHLDRTHGVATFTLSHHLSGRTWFVILLSWIPLLALMTTMFAVEGLAASVGVREGSTLHLVLSYGTLLALAGVGLALLRGSRTRLRVGPDGVMIRRLWRSRFLPYGEIASVERWPGARTQMGMAASEGFDIVLRSGERFRLRSLGNRTALGDVMGDFIALEVERGLAESKALGRDLPLTLSAPREPLRAWVGELRRLAGSGGEYRTPGLSREAVCASLADPSAEPIRRVACAVLLVEMGDADAVHAAAKATASPQLRRALEAAAEPDDEALESALRTLQIT